MAPCYQPTWWQAAEPRTWPGCPLGVSAWSWQGLPCPGQLTFCVSVLADSAAIWFGSSFLEQGCWGSVRKHSVYTHWIFPWVRRCHRLLCQQTQNEHILYVPSPEDSSAPEVPSLEEEADTHTPRRRWAARACGGSSLSFPGGACGSVVPSLAPRRLVVFVGEGCVLCVLLLCHRA